MTSMFYEHPQTLSLWSVHLENKGNLLLPNHLVIKGKDSVVISVYKDMAMSQSKSV